MTPEDRAAWIAAFRTVLDIAEAHPDIRLPYITTVGNVEVDWYLWPDANYREPGRAARDMATLEQAIPCKLTGRISERGDRYELAGTLGGIAVKVTATAGEVAEYTVTGQEVIEHRDWIRRPVPAGEPQGSAAEEGGTES